MVIAYLESGSHADVVGIFDDEETYEACVPALEKLAEKHRMTLTESVRDEQSILELYHKIDDIPT